MTCALLISASVCVPGAQETGTDLSPHARRREKVSVDLGASVSENLCT